MRVVISKSGIFSLSMLGKKRYMQFKGHKPYFFLEKLLEVDGEYMESCTPVSFEQAEDLKEKGYNVRVYFDKYRETIFYDFEIERTDPALIETIEMLGDKASNYCELKIVDVPDDVGWYIENKGEGTEWVAEKHRTWN